MRFTILTVLLIATCLSTASAEQPAVRFDFSRGTHGWMPANQVENMRVSAEGLQFECVGNDPYIVSPPVKGMPLGNRVQLIIRMRSEANQRGEIFFGRSFTAQNSVGFTVQNDGQWHEYQVILPPQEKGARLRIDPATAEGPLTIAWIKVFDMQPLSAGPLPSPTAVELQPPLHSVRSGDLMLAHSGQQWDAFGVWIDGQKMARSHGNPQLGVVVNDDPVYLNLSAATLEVTIPTEGEIHVTASLQDAGGANWQVRRAFVAGDDGAITVRTAVSVDQQRSVFHVPMLTLLAGWGTFGEEKQQGVLPGVEYLENEPSSSEADVRGPQANRRIVENHKLCFPMMSIVAEDRYVGLIWNRDDRPAAVFDSPDRIFDSGSHLMGLWLPGVGPHRLENELDVLRPLNIQPDQPLTLTATLIGGHGQHVNSPVQHYVRLASGLPPVPEYDTGFDAAVRLLAHGWLDSALHEDGTWRHAVWGDQFPARPAADAPGYMLWLAEHTDDAELAERLRAATRRGLERLGDPGNWEARCSHVARPFAPLLFGQIEPYAQRRLAAARQSLRGFDDQGLVRYRPQAGRPDYGSTHWEDHANGLSALRLEPILEAAVFTGDADLADQALAILDKQLEVYHNTVPRGAQTWEMPLHTPDILASGRVVACCNLAYQLTGDPKYLEASRHWAWTGVSMVYLDPPTDGPVGLYATTAVLGATNWTAPFWIGLPVQWCGLVYRSSLQELARLDSEQREFWNQLAVGITRSGLQQSFPLDDPQHQGLLADFFFLREQRPDGPAISPGTVQANLAEAYDRTPIYTLERIGPDGMLLHAPGQIRSIEQDGATIRVVIEGWSSEPYWLRLVRIPAMPRIELQGGRLLETQFDADRKTLNLQVHGKGPFTLLLTPSQATSDNR